MIVAMVAALMVASYMVGGVRQAVMLLERDPRVPRGERDAAGCLVLAAQAVVFLAFFAFVWIYA